MSINILPLLKVMKEYDMKLIKGTKDYITILHTDGEPLTQTVEAWTTQFIDEITHISNVSNEDIATTLYYNKVLKNLNRLKGRC